MLQNRIGVQELRQGDFEDPLTLCRDALNKLNTLWMRLTYPFAEFGPGVSIDYSCEIHRAGSRRIRIGNSVYIARDAWLNVPEPLGGAADAIIFGNGCKIGRRCMISAKNQVFLENDVLLGPSVLITDHSHEFSNLETPIHAQGLTAGGKVRIEQNCWLGHGSAIVCTSGELVLGRNCVVGANCVVTRSVPAFSVVTGNPAKVVNRFNRSEGKWTRDGLS